MNVKSSLIEAKRGVLLYEMEHINENTIRELATRPRIEGYFPELTRNHKELKISLSI